MLRVSYSLILSLFLISSSISISARALDLEPSPLFSSYCMALLRGMSQKKSSQQLEMAATLERFAKKVNQELELAVECNTGDLYRGRLWAPPATLWLNDPNHNRSDFSALLRAPVRIENLLQDISSVKFGVHTGGLEIRGQQAILDYIASIQDLTAAYEAQLRPVYGRVYPYFRTQRLVAHSVLAGIPMSLAGALAYWTGEPLLHRHLNSWQTAALIGAGVGVYGLRDWLSPIGHSFYWYLRGLLIKKYRTEYEQLYGTLALPSNYSYLEKLADILKDPKTTREALVYYNERRIFSESDMDEVRTAAANGTLPSDEFIKNQETGIIQTGSDLAVSYDFLTDIVYFFDELKDEPVLQVFVRFIARDSGGVAAPMSREGAGPRGLDFGGLRPAGL